jgi:hypothetical protein
MKTYISEKQLSMVGQVWEIRTYLKSAQRKLKKDTSLLTYLAEQTDDADHKSSAFEASDEADADPSHPIITNSSTYESAPIYIH